MTNLHRAVTGRSDMIRAILYCRVSTKEQTKNLSLTTQLEACREYCSREGFDVAAAFIEEGESAKTSARPQLQRLLAYCRQHRGQVQFLIVYNLSRFARERHDHVVLRVLLQQLGVSLRSVTEPIDDTSTGKLMEGVLASFAQFDNDVRADRTKAGMAAALQAGRWTFQAPVGYLNARESGSSLIPDPERAPLIRQAFEEYAAGHATRQEILRRVNSLGLRTRRGAPLSAQSFNTMLRNPIYAGRIVVPTWHCSYQGDFEPLVSEKTFRGVQARLEGRGVAVTPHRRNHPDFPLRRFIACQACGTPLTGSWSTGRSSRYGYYSCRTRGCRQVNIRKERLEADFVTLLECLQPNAAYMRLFREIVLDVWKQHEADAIQHRKTVARHGTELQRRLDRLEETFIFQSTIDQATYDRQRDKLREQMALAEIELQEAKLDALDVEGILGFAEHLLTNAARVWVEASLDQRQRLQRVFFPEGLQFDGEAFGTAVTCLAFRDLEELRPTGTDVASPTGP